MAVVGLAMLLAQPLVVDDEVHAYGHGVDDEAAQIILFPVRQQVTEQHVVEANGGEMDKWPATAVMTR